MINNNVCRHYCFVRAVVSYNNMTFLMVLCILTMMIIVPNLLCFFEKNHPCYVNQNNNQYNNNNSNQNTNNQNMNKNVYSNTNNNRDKNDIIYFKSNNDNFLLNYRTSYLFCNGFSIRVQQQHQHYIMNHHYNTKLLRINHKNIIINNNIFQHTSSRKNSNNKNIYDVIENDLNTNNMSTDNSQHQSFLLLSNHEQLQYMIEECWSQTSFTIIPMLLLQQQQQYDSYRHNNKTNDNVIVDVTFEMIDPMLQGLMSPAPHSFYTIQRALNIMIMEYNANNNNNNEMIMSSNGNHDWAATYHHRHRNRDHELNLYQEIYRICYMLNYLIKDKYVIILNVDSIIERQQIMQQLWNHQQQHQQLIDRGDYQNDIVIPILIPGIDWKVIPLCDISLLNDESWITWQHIQLLHHNNDKEKMQFNVDNDDVKNTNHAKSKMIFRTTSRSSSISKTISSSSTTTLQLAKKLLLMKSKISMTSTVIEQQEESDLYEEMKERLFITFGTDLRGRTASDTAFTLSLCGMIDNNIYNTLYQISRLEIQRCLVNRISSSLRMNDLLHIIEKLAASGVKTNINVDISYDIVSNIIEEIIYTRRQEQQSSKKKKMTKIKKKKMKDISNSNNIITDQEMTSLMKSRTLIHIDDIDIVNQEQDDDDDMNDDHLLLLEVIQTIRKGSNHFHLLHPRPLLWLWRFSSRLDKITSFNDDDDNTNSRKTNSMSSSLSGNTMLLSNHSIITSNANDIDETLVLSYSNNIGSITSIPISGIDWLNTYTNCTNKGLIIDIGSGFGVSLLGLASRQYEIEQQQQYQQQDSIDNQTITLPWNNNKRLSSYNYIGCDLNHLGIEYSNAMSIRWNVSNILHYYNIPVNELLDQVIYYYPSLYVSCILLQFPTPYQLPSRQNDTNHDMNNHRNMQLPSTTESGFMITSNVMSKIVYMIQNSKDDNATLIIQSNCEDVAIYLCDLAIKHGLYCIPVSSPVLTTATSSSNNNNQQQQQQRIPLRTQRWLDNMDGGGGGGDNKQRRAIGVEWSTIPFLPNYCATETEVACNIINQTPIHRCILSKHSSLPIS